MTVQEIKQGLEFTRDMFLFNPLTGETLNRESLNDMDKTTLDAVEGALECLEELQAQREAWIKVIKVIKEYQKDAFYYDDVVIRRRHILEVINKYKPKEGHKLKVGHWIQQQSHFGPTHSYECSECGRTIYVEDDNLSDFPYCHCGTKMEVQNGS